MFIPQDKSFVGALTKEAKDCVSIGTFLEALEMSITLCLVFLPRYQFNLSSLLRLLVLVLPLKRWKTMMNIANMSENVYIRWKTDLCMQNQDRNLRFFFPISLLLHLIFLVLVLSLSIFLQEEKKLLQ